MSEKKRWLEHHAPLGIDVETEKGFFLFYLLLVTFRSGLFLLVYGIAVGDLYTYRAGKKILIEGAIIQEFSTMIEGRLLPVGLICIIAVLVAIYHYFYHYQGSKMMYLMKRLPDKWELHRRCWTLPITGAVVMMVWMQILKLIYYAIYIFCTPSQCLPL